MLKLTDAPAVPCPTCQGKGRVPCPAQMTKNGLQAAGTGYPIPCPECRGAKVTPGSAEPTPTSSGGWAEDRTRG